MCIRDRVKSLKMIMMMMMLIFLKQVYLNRRNATVKTKLLLSDNKSDKFIWCIKYYIATDVTSTSTSLVYQIHVTALGLFTTTVVHTCRSWAREMFILIFFRSLRTLTFHRLLGRSLARTPPWESLYSVLTVLFSILRPWSSHFSLCILKKEIMLRSSNAAYNYLFFTLPP